MYTTEEAITALNDDDNYGLTFFMTSNENVHIFKSLTGEIYMGEFGNGKIVKFNQEEYENEEWIVGY